MKNLHLLDAMRRTGADVLQYYGSMGNHASGVFDVPSPIDRCPMLVVASSELGWDHVSVSRPTRCPNWPEMDHVKRLFFADDEVVMQLHVAVKDHINVHPYCLHLWRPQKMKIPLPDAIMVA